MSREKKFTPGPWEQDGSKGDMYPCISDSNDNLISQAFCCSDREDIPASEAEANADLISAAPELLEACENILKVIDCFGMSSCPHVHEVGGCGGEDEDCDWLINAREAIKKAYGETK